MTSTKKSSTQDIFTRHSQTWARY